MRDFRRFDEYLSRLARDVYPQPQDEKHTLWAEESIAEFMALAREVESVIDLGCGEGFCQPFFEKYGVRYLGVCLGKDYKVSLSENRNVQNLDFSFLPFTNNSYDMLYARHALEHSPMPLLTLMEWHRVSKRYLALVLPSPVFWGIGGRNHYSVLNDLQWKVLFDAAGFSVTYESKKIYHMAPDKDAADDEIEYRYLLEKK